MHVVVKLVIALPLFAAAVNDTTNDPVAVVVEADTAFTAVGAAGDPTVTAGDSADIVLVPTAFTAATLNLYAVPFDKPVNE